jgi:ubiquinone/menaquinone biosynthesis C-methylase UbiE
MVSFKRWLKAQEYERSFWKKSADRIASGISGQLSWYGWRAGELEKRLVRYMDDEKKKSAKVLEIGSGPIGIVSFLKWGKRFAIDPLEEHYINNPILTKLRNSEVRYLKGQGESIPFDEGTFSMVIIDNVIDHTSDPDIVMKEIYRVLKNEGLLYLSVNIHTLWGAKIHRLLSTLAIDKGHPYTFTIDRIRSLLKNNNFRIEDETVENYHEVRRKDRQSKILKSKVKGYTGLTEFLYQAICRES